jgi:DNA-binding GntR family transcriptional regulator
MSTGVRSVGEQITARLRGDLLSGVFPSGIAVREESLASRYGVSRMPVRAALQQLVLEGLLLAKRNCGVTVAPPPSGVVRSLLTPVRSQLEEYALLQGLPHYRSEQFDEWGRVLRRLHLACENRDRGEILDCDFEFHELLFRHAGLEELIPVWRPVISRLRGFHGRQNQRISDGELAVIHHVHLELLKEFRSGQPRRALAALRSHIEDGDFNEHAKRTFHANGRKTRR